MLQAVTPLQGVQNTSHLKAERASSTPAGTKHLTFGDAPCGAPAQKGTKHLTFKG